jgi:MoaA/NifB/PqqE/SkfB family radical SAM enzyme
MESLDEKIKVYNATRASADAVSVCHAPSRNMFFGNRGYVFACCFNKLHVLGKYPDQSLLNIWNGENAGQLREALAANNFRLGCQGCRQLIDEGNFEALPAKVYDRAFSAAGFPTRLEFELDNTCNYECIMCSGEFSSSIRERRERKPPVISPYGKDFVEELIPFIPHLQTAQFLGGEPFLIPVYFDIWEKMIEANPEIRISIQTNGSILNARVQKILKSLKFSISVSLDGATADTYERIRLNGSFERVMKNLDYFSAYTKRKETGLSISFCPMPQNWHEIPAMINLCNSFGAEVFFNTVYHPAECSLMNMERPSLITAVETLKSAEIAGNSTLECKNKRKFLALLLQMEQWTMQTESKAALHVEKAFGSYHELMEAVKNYAVKQNPGSADALSGEIAHALNYIVGKSREEDIEERTMQYLLKLQVANLYEAVPGNSPERLYVLFKERVLNLV